MNCKICGSTMTQEVYNGVCIRCNIARTTQSNGIGTEPQPSVIHAPPSEWDKVMSTFVLQRKMEIDRIIALPTKKEMVKELKKLSEGYSRAFEKIANKYIP